MSAHRLQASTPHRPLQLAALGWRRRRISLALGLPPHALAFKQDREGRPELVSPKVDGFDFNHSRALDYGVLALSWSGRIGVDAEWPEAVDETLDLVVAQQGSPEECALWQSMPAALKPAAFARFWTRKEALVKAWGLGLQVPLATLNLGFEGTRLVRTPQFGGSGCWLLRSFENEGVPTLSLAHAVRDETEEAPIEWVTESS